MLRIAAWLSRADRPTAVIGEDFRIDDIRRAAERAGLRCPVDPELVGVGGSRSSLPGGTPHLSLQYDRVARHIVDLVMVEEEHDICQSRRVPRGIHAGRHELLRRCMARGCRLIAYGTDVSLLISAAGQAAASLKEYS